MDCTHTECDGHGHGARRPMEPAAIAHLEERRRALELVALADEHELVAGGAMAFSGEGSWTNFASGLGLEGPVGDADIDRLVTFYASRGVTPRVEVCPFADPSLLNGLGERGFMAQEYERVLARGLTGGDEPTAAPPEPDTSGVELEFVQSGDGEQVAAFVEAWARDARSSDAPKPESAARVARRSVEDPNVDNLLVRLDGAPIGATTTGFREELACLAGIRFLPAARRLGLERTVLLRRLEHARRRGCTLAVVHAEPDTPAERDAILLDFVAAYTKVLMEMTKYRTR